MSAKLIPITELNNCGSIDAFMPAVSCLFEAAPCLAHKVNIIKSHADFLRFTQRDHMHLIQN
jgi:hypothetical protein